VDGMKSTEQFTKYWKDRKIDWKSHYFNPSHPHRKMILDLIKTSPNGVRSILEIGCGAGANLYNIKKAFPQARVCGCDLNPDAIKTAQEIFKEFKTTDPINVPLDYIKEIDFRVGGIDAIPFHGEYFDLVITDAMMIYIDKSNLDRAIREIRRVGYEKFIFCELHSNNWFKRLGLKLARGYNVYDWNKLLKKYNFKAGRVSKIPTEVWPDEPWRTFGNVMTALR
jgi:SAM-dependent methyltransferase